MKQLRLSNEEEYSRRFRAHLSTWEQEIAANPSLQPQVSLFNKLKYTLIAAILYWPLKTTVKHQDELADFIPLIILGLLLLVGLVIWLVRRDNARAQLAAQTARNNLLISPYLYAQFLDIEPRGDIDARCDIGLFCAGMRLAVPTHWAAAEINGMAVYFLADKGLILCKDNPEPTQSPIIFGSSPNPNTHIAASRLQLSEFADLAATGHLYSSDPTAAQRLLRQKEPLIVDILQRQGAAVSLLYSQKQQFFYLADFQTDFSFFDLDASPPEADMLGFYLRLCRALVDFEQL